ncbi:CLUMA_CG008136, isoform A, partial [Clunio marinus]
MNKRLNPKKITQKNVRKVEKIFQCKENLISFFLNVFQRNF